MSQSIPETSGRGHCRRELKGKALRDRCKDLFSHGTLYAAFFQRAAVTLELSNYITVHVVSLAAGCLTITDSGGTSYFSPACPSSLSYLL